MRIPRSTRGAATLLIGLGVQAAGTAYAQSDYNDYMMKRQLLENCFDQTQPAAQRLASCTRVIKEESLEKSQARMVYVARAQAFQQSGDDGAALQDLTTAVKLDPKSEQAWIARANLYAAKGNYADALADYNKATQINPNDPVPYDNRGIALQGMGKPEDAIADFTRAIALDPHDLTAYSNRATLNLAASRLDRVIADLTEVIGAQPTDGMAHYNRGTAYERSGELDKALDDYRSAARLQPSFAPAIAALGRLLKDKDPDAAVSELSQAIRLDPHSPALRARATLYLSMGRLDQALRDFDQVIANDGADAIAYLNRGVTNEKLGHLGDAIRDYSRSLELASSDVVHVDRGNAYAQLDQPQKALADFNAVLASEPQNVAALLGKANAQYAQKALTASLDDYSRVIAADPRNTIAYFKRGNVDLDLRDFAAAYRDYTESLKLDPNQAVALYNRAIAASRMGQRKDAAEDRRRALALDPELASDEARSKGSK